MVLAGVGFCPHRHLTANPPTKATRQMRTPWRSHEGPGESCRVDVAFYIHQSGGSARRDPPYAFRHFIVGAVRTTMPPNPRRTALPNKGCCRSRLAGDPVHQSGYRRQAGSYELVIPQTPRLPGAHGAPYEAFDLSRRQTRAKRSAKKTAAQSGYRSRTRRKRQCPRTDYNLTCIPWGMPAQSDKSQDQRPFSFVTCLQRNVNGG